MSFEEAATAFDDPYALLIEDETHSDDETRELLIGYSKRNRLLFVVFIERSATVVRLISARFDVEESDYDFSWNEKKAAANLRLHQVSFSEAATVFKDSFALMIYDEDHSDDETREITIGYSNRKRLLFVSFTEREPNFVRLVSARLATRAERDRYEKKDD